jgi:hypothetical protein
MVIIWLFNYQEFFGFPPCWPLCLVFFFVVVVVVVVTARQLVFECLPQSEAPHLLYVLGLPLRYRANLWTWHL